MGNIRLTSGLNLGQIKHLLHSVAVGWAMYYWCAIIVQWNEWHYPPGYCPRFESGLSVFQGEENVSENDNKKWRQ